MGDKETVVEMSRKGGGFLLSESDCSQVFTPEDFTDEHKQIADTAEQFAINEVMPHLEEIENKQFDVTVGLLKKAAELGLFLVDIPEAYGGLELDKAASMLVAEKISVTGSFAVAFSDHAGIGTLPIIYYGTDKQKEEYLPKIASLDVIGAYGLTEPDAGTDALAAKTSAILSDDGKYYVLNGTKQFITNGAFADYVITFAKVDKKDFTGFIIDTKLEGVEIGPEEKKMGIKGSSTTQVILNNVKVPVDKMLGEIGKGHKIAFNVLNVGRFKLGAASVGGSKYGLAEAIKYANERKQFGKLISSFGAIKEKISHMTALTYAAESMTYRLAGSIDDKIHSLDKNLPDYYEKYQAGIEEYVIECSAVKVFCSEAMDFVADESVQILGGYGYINEYFSDRFYRDSRINRLFEGTNEINRLLTTGMMLRKAMKGELPFQNEAMKAFEDIMSPSLTEIDDTILFAAEKKLLSDLKKAFLIVAGAGVQKYMDKIQNEQEVLMASADMIIDIFALESSILRAEKNVEKVSENKKDLYKAVVKSLSFYFAEKISTNAKRCAFYVEGGDNLTMILGAIRKFTKYNAEGLLEARRKIADAAIESEKYIF